MTTSDDLRTVGILGGMSSESTVEYYRGIDRGINDALGGHAAGDLVIRSVNFGDVERFIRTDQWERAGEYLAAAARDLEAAGADFLVMATNTMHRVAPAITDAVSIPFVHIVDVTAGAVTAAGVETVGVLGTRTTMEAPFYADRFGEYGVEVVDDLVERGAGGLVLGCTEIELLVEQDDRPGVPMFDTTGLHVERAVERSLGDAPDGDD